jgi:hypothetical protein
LRLENQVPGQDAPNSKEHQVHVEGVSAHPEKGGRQRLQLCGAKAAERSSSLQDNQESEIEKCIDCQHGATHKHDEDCQDRDAPVDFFRVVDSDIRRRTLLKNEQINGKVIVCGQ